MTRVALPPTCRPWRRVIDSAVTPGRRSSAKITGSLSGSSVRRRSSISRTAAAMVRCRPSTAPSTGDRPGRLAIWAHRIHEPSGVRDRPSARRAQATASPRSALCRNLSLPYRTRTRTSHEVPPWGPACTARPIELKRFKIE